MDFSSGALTGLVLASLLMFTIITVQICVRLNRYRLTRQHLQHQERRINAIRNAVACNNDQEILPEDRYDPPEYWQCVDNAGFLADDTDAKFIDDSKLPSYENYIKGDFVEYAISSSNDSLPHVSTSEQVVLKVDELAYQNEHSGVNGVERPEDTTVSVGEIDLETNEDIMCRPSSDEPCNRDDISDRAHLSNIV